MVQIHYHPSGKPETDTSSIGLTFSGPPTKGKTSILMVNTDIDMAPGDARYVVKSSLTLPRDVEMSSVFPHAHWLCKDMKIDATLPDGTVNHLIWIADWDFNWQGGYRFETPLPLPKGTRDRYGVYVRQSRRQPARTLLIPFFSQRVTFGEQTTDEMAVGLSRRDSADARPISRHFQREMRHWRPSKEFVESGDLTTLRGRIPGGGARLQQLMKAFDKNGDGKLDADRAWALMQYLRTVM